MRRSLLLVLVLALGAYRPAAGQVVLVPSERAPYRQKFDVQLPDAQYLLVPRSGSLPEEPGPLAFRFARSELNALLDAPATVHYVTVGDGGVHLQVLNLRAGELPAEALGPQAFEVVDTAGAVVGTGTLLVLGRPPEAGAISAGEGSPILELGRETPVWLTIRTNGNYARVARVVNRRDLAVSDLREVLADSTGTVRVSAVVRALRADAAELRLAVETADGRTVELEYPGLTVREPVPHRLTVRGGPIFLDAVGRGGAELRLGASDPLDPEAAEVRTDGPELVVTRLGGDGDSLTVRVEFLPRSSPGTGMRAVRELTVRQAGREYRGWVEVIGSPSVASVRSERDGRPVLLAGSAPTVLRIAGVNLDGLRLDCGPLGPGARCRTVSSSPTELVAEVTLGPEAREGEVWLPLAASDGRDGRAAGVSPVRVEVERPSVPAALGAGMLRLDCGGRGRCRENPRDSSFIVRPGDARRLAIRVDASRIPEDAGWQRLLFTVTRVRGEQRQVVRTVGSAAAPRLFRAGVQEAPIALLDASSDPRHGDLFVVEVEHAAGQYPPDERARAAAEEPYTIRVYVDAGTARRITGDIAVQPVLLAVSTSGKVAPLYPNAGLGVTWQFLDDHLQARPFSLRLQALATNLRATSSDADVGAPALLLSGNVRVPGTDPSKPLVLSAGIARMFGAAEPWQLLVGASMDLGVASLIFGG